MVKLRRWRNLAGYFSLPDEQTLRRSAVRHYLKTIAPDLVRRALQPADVQYGINRIAAPEKQVVDEICGSPEVKHDVHQLILRSGIDVLRHVRERQQLILGMPIVIVLGFLGLLGTTLFGDAPPSVASYLALVGMVTLALILLLRTLQDYYFRVAPGGNIPAAFTTSGLRALLDEAEREVLQPWVRKVVNRHLEGKSTDDSLKPGPAPGLHDARGNRFVVTTAGFQAALDRIDQLDGGAVLITGARGTGKSALIQWVLNRANKRSPIPGGISVQVPSIYEPRDFILHLHTAACTVAIDHELKSAWRRVLDQTASILRPALATILVVAGLAALVVWTWGSFPLLQDGWSVALPWAGVALSAVGLAGGVVGVVARRLHLRGPNSLLTLARSDLARVRYLQTFTSGWSGKIAAPGSDLTLSRTRQVAERARSLPEVVQDFRSLIERMIDGRYRLIIAIDELDKLHDTERAQRFIDDIRAILDIPGCLYLTALSNDAAAHFGRRVSTTKTALDSSFDIAVRMRPMTARDSSDALAARVVGFSRNFRLLAHLASGGRPRELIRVARKILDYARSEQGITVVQSARMLVAELGEENLHAVSIALRDSDDESTRTFAVAIQPGGSLETYRDAVRTLARSGGSDPLRWELLAYHAYLVTLRYFFEHGQIGILLEDDQPTVLLTMFEQAIELLPNDARRVFGLVNEVRAKAGLTEI